ncbi:rCG58780 [Rattus norvegicus]|uniref:Keratin-associated protein n=2 Tax=Rattus norvegicus TaxID=10116 RepID=A6JLA0_RAT|nr:keratin associated protein 13-2 [Rattus norvegicus]EDM10665.1 rCG58780 [Rattus norvegicus]|eukprot:NP_001102795.1 keratin associated protein 13-2 [Rattus norvegicus]
MAYSCCSGNFSSRSLRSCLPSSGSCLASSYPSNLVYTTTSCSPSTCQLGSSLNSGCQETCIEPTSCQRSCVVSSPCQKPCYYPRSYTPCSPCQGTYAGSLSFGSRSCSSLGYGSRICYPVGCRSSGFGSMNCGVYGFPSLSYGSRCYYPTYLASSSCQPCYRPICGLGLYGTNC